MTSVRVQGFNGIVRWHGGDVPREPSPANMGSRVLVVASFQASYDSGNKNVTISFNRILRLGFSQ